MVLSIAYKPNLVTIWMEGVAAILPFWVIAVAALVGGGVFRSFLTSSNTALGISPIGPAKKSRGWVIGKDTPTIRLKGKEEMGISYRCRTPLKPCECKSI